eukprot:9325084-Alexandrium_andersonii.AAC.1
MPSLGGSGFGFTSSESTCQRACAACDLEREHDVRADARLEMFQSILAEQPFLHTNTNTSARVRPWRWMLRWRVHG